MRFAAPVYLAVLVLLVPAIASVAAAGEARRRAALRAFGDEALLGRAAPLPAARPRAVRWGLLVAALALGLVALARPQLGEEPAATSRAARDLLFVLDLSRSMNAEDVRPSRLEAAKAAVRGVLEAMPGDRAGLVVFGGSGFLQVPLTLDRSAFAQLLDAAGTASIPDPGTSLPAALATAAAAFEHGDRQAPYRAVVLLSDGENLTDGDVQGPMAALKRSGARVFAVGVGTREGARIPLRVDGRLVDYHRDGLGRAVVTRLEEEPLRWIAQEAGGEYVRWDGDAAVRRLVEGLSRVEARAVAGRAGRQPVDRYRWPLALGLATLAAESLLHRSSRVGSRRLPGPGAALPAPRRPFLASRPDPGPGRPPRRPERLR